MEYNMDWYLFLDSENEIEAISILIIRIETLRKGKKFIDFP
jgi:hypothetical protein